MFFKNTLWIHARYEIILLWRSWFFRIFSIAALVLLTGFSLIMYTTLVSTPWAFKALSSFLPFVIVLFLNISQIILIIFLASDTFRREERVNSSEVTLIRSTTNTGYVAGKALGVVCVMLLLDILMLLIIAIIQVTIGASPFTLAPYLIYPLIMILPATLFAIGMTFFLVRFLKSQAVSFVLMLGVIAISLIYTGDKFFGIFDLTGLYLPLVYSDFIGISNLNMVILQRLIYLGAGLGFILLAGYYYERLPQSKPVRSLSLVFGITFLISSVIFGGVYWQLSGIPSENRQIFRQLNQQWQGVQAAEISAMRINLEHSGQKIKASAEIEFAENTTVQNAKYIFSLNPALHILAIHSDHQPLKYQRAHHLIEVRHSGKLKFITIEYEGKIDESVCFAGIPDEKHESLHSVFLYKSDKRYAFLENTFVLLPPNALWYPVAGLPPGAAFPEQTGGSFIRFHLTVKTDPGLSVIAQGTNRAIEPGLTEFLVDKPLKELSLVIGPYIQFSRSIDSVNYVVSVLPDHDIFNNYFTAISDTLDYMIRDGLADFERRFGLEYPFTNLHMVEIPIQFFSFEEIHSVKSPRVHPEQVWLAEKGALYPSLDFDQSGNRMMRFGQERALSEQELQLISFRNIINQVFMERGGGRNFMNDLADDQPGGNLMPLFFSHTFSIKTGGYPLLYNALEAYLLKKLTGASSTPPFFNEGLTTAEKAIITFRDKSLAEALRDSLDNENTMAFLKLKGEYLINLVQSYTTPEVFDRQIQDLIRENRFSVIDPALITDKWQEKMDRNTDLLITEWYADKGFAGFLYKDLEMYKTLYNNRLKYQVKMKAANPEPRLGLFKISFRFGGRRAFMMGETEEEMPDYIVRMDGNSAKEIGIVLDAEPRSVFIDGVAAVNIPLTRDIRFEDAQIYENRPPLSGEREIPLFDLQAKNEIIVDNEDTGFKVINIQPASLIMNLIHGGGDRDIHEFGEFNFWRPPGVWQKVKGQDFYGKYISSAFYIHGRQGDNKVKWTGQLPESGYYKTYAYIQDPAGSFGPRRQEMRIVQDFEYIVYHDDGQETVTIDIEKKEKGWVELGGYYFSEGEAVIELSDKSEGLIVIADAVKWVKE
ncbi:MAG: hypothetical protein JXR46_12215 [Calditrichaceae bacterium]|nr:hypothetical protein [Calditrichaceae bacterium]